jgi:nucleotide-binding universal stress UspA family protein
MKTIVVGHDASEAAERALERAAELAEALKARLTVVCVSTPPLPAPVLEPILVPGGGPTPLTEPESNPKELAQRRLEQARSRLASRSLDTDYVADAGPAAERLLALADERDADLIVVGSGDHGLLERLVAPPVEEAVARRAGRDVLIVH